MTDNTLDWKNEEDTGEKFYHSFITQVIGKKGNNPRVATRLKQWGSAWAVLTWAGWEILKWRQCSLNTANMVLILFLFSYCYTLEWEFGFKENCLYYYKDAIKKDYIEFRSKEITHLILFTFHINLMNHFSPIFSTYF